MSDSTTVRIKGSRVLKETLAAINDPRWKIIVNQGGTRSSKTYSIAQANILTLLSEVGQTLTISRKTSPSLRASVMRDFFDILKSMSIYSESSYVSASKEYYLHGNLVDFVSLDEPQKKRGTKRSRLWLNESNEFTYEDFFQMMIRTSGQIFLDYNPSDEFHWIYDKVLPRKDCLFIKSNYLDNPFLEKSIVHEIELLRETDPNLWRVFGQGERGQSQALIYSNWDIIEEMPQSFDTDGYGVDFGFNNPSAVIRCGIKDKVDVYVDEELYETRLTNSDLIDRLNFLIPDKGRVIKADSAEPDRIQELQMAGFNCEPCMKGKNSVKNGIDVVKRKRLHITRRSVNVLKEIKNYKWKSDRDGRVLDEPVPFMNHAMDAMRYAIGDMAEAEPMIW
jgi:phage terminase large subunit